MQPLHTQNLNQGASEDVSRKIGTLFAAGAKEFGAEGKSVDIGKIMSRRAGPNEQPFLDAMIDAANTLAKDSGDPTWNRVAKHIEFRFKRGYRTK